jgi:hypothetical protein
MVSLLVVHCSSIHIDPLETTKHSQVRHFISQFISDMSLQCWTVAGHMIMNSLHVYVNLD